MPAVSAPRWLIEVVRPKRVAPPWLRMVRAPLAICVPLGVAFAVGQVAMGLPAALGGLISTIAERGGPYFGRAKRVAVTVIAGNACGLAIGLFVHGRGWVVVVVVVLLALLSAAISATGNTGSLVGLQLLLYAVLGSGPLASIAPGWLVIGLFLAGAGWALALFALEWALSPHVPEQQSVAAAYRAIAGMVRAAATPEFEEARQAATTALNTAYDDVLTARGAVAGRDPRRERLVTLLNGTHRLVEAAVTLSHEKHCPLALVHAIESLADAIAHDTRVPPLPRVAEATPGAQALLESLASATDALSGDSPRASVPRRSGRQWLREYLAELRHGRLVHVFAIRLALCLAVAAVLSEIVPLQRSYWVMLTVVVVLKPDFGSVFARALQRGIGTVVGAVIGAAILAVTPYGPALLAVVAALAFLVPYTISRNWGMFGTLLTPLVLVIIDLPSRAGWPLAEARLIDTLLGCGIVLLLGYAPWPSSWHADVGRRFAAASEEIADYLRALGTDPDSTAVGDHRRKAYRLLSDVRTVFQRALSEPAAVSRRATAWYPAVAGLERTLDAIAAVSVRVRRNATGPASAALQRLAEVMEEFTAALRSGHEPPRRGLPDDSATAPISEAVNDVIELFQAKS